MPISLQFKYPHEISVTDRDIEVKCSIWCYQRPLLTIYETSPSSKDGAEEKFLLKYKLESAATENKVMRVCYRIFDCLLRLNVYCSLICTKGENRCTYYLLYKQRELK